MRIRKVLIWSVLLLFLVSSIALAAPKKPLDVQSLNLKTIQEIVASELDEQKALENVAYTYLGWRTNGGPWFNAVLDWIGEELESIGFTEGIDASGAKYWNQENLRPGLAIWDPKYASLEILSPEGLYDDFNFYLDGFDPNSAYYPEHITFDWIKDNIGSEEEAALNERCRLARYSGFTDSTGVRPEDAGITAEAVYVGEVLRYRNESNQWVYYGTKNTEVDLQGKIIFATNNRSYAYSLAIQEGAVASLCSQINTYNNPIIDGQELNPTVAKYAAVGNSNAAYDVVAFNLSPWDERYLKALFESTTEPVMMRVVAIGEAYPYTVEQPLRTLVVEIPGASKPDERIVMAAHVQEPGANDNASGVGLQLELVRTLKTLIDQGKLPQPERTLTFIWGAEITMVRLWSERHPDQMLNAKAGLILDMVGQDPEQCGGVMRIEKTPDPSAIYVYRTDRLPGEEEPAMTSAFVRGPDSHSLWGKGSLQFEPYPGFYLNDLYIESAASAAKDVDGSFLVEPNPYEGGSDHTPFLWFRHPDTNEYHPRPSVLTWHFTDYFYHSNLDTMDKVSKTELRGVGLTTLNVGLMIAYGGETQGLETMEIVRREALKRFGWERENSEGHLLWAYNRARNAGKTPVEIQAAIDEALDLEIEILNAWAVWYKEAHLSVRELVGTNTTMRYDRLEERNLREIDRLVRDAELKATLLANKLKRDTRK
jgi:hypothetical protein